MKNEIAVFGGGCFWCTEAVFKMLRGVSSVLPGYAGGSTIRQAHGGESGRTTGSPQAAPTYEEVSGGRTGHAEVIQVTYNPELITYNDLLTVFFASHDPTTLNRQGNDVGTQYRSVIFYTSEVQKKEAEDFIQELNASSKEGKVIVTELAPLQIFYEAENYHKDYFAKHPENPYCELIINPKLEKVQQKFAKLLKTHAS
ncbi:MAG: peptide-methionine (S)-S-oxide reductase MsrA [bacterium]|nr:peptide-methionine (S)-S-oxide reductase MsrA [bacterium]